VGAVAHLTSAQARLQQVMGASPGLQQQQQSSAGSQNGKDASSTASTLSASQGSEPKPKQQQESAFDAPGFVENVNKYLLGPAPPRAAVVMSTEAAYAYLKGMLGHLQQATDVLHVRGYRALVQHIERFSRLRAGVVARSAAHYLIAGKAWGPAMASATALSQATAVEAAAVGGTPNNGTAHSTPADSKHSHEAAAGHKDASSSTNPGQDIPPPPWVLDRPIMSEACALPEAPGAAGPEVDLFLEQIVIASSNWAQSMLLNSCRQRRRLRRGLDDWANIYQHALNADMSEEFVAFAKRAQWAWTPPKDEAEAMNEFYPGPLSTWVECQTAASEALHLLLGFELELYQPSEYAMVYWYCSVLLGVQRVTSQVMHSYRCPASGASKASIALPAKPNKKGNKGRAATPPSPLPDASTARRQAGLIMDAVRTELLSSMCLGLVRLQLALKVAGIVPDPILTFNSERERFDQRFAAFHTPPLVRPEPMGYGQYLEAVASADDMAPEQLLALAIESFAMVRRSHAQIMAQVASAHPQMSTAVPPDQVTEHAALDRIAAANTLAANIVIRSLASLPKVEGEQQQQQQQPRPKPSVCVTYNWSMHPFFPALGVKSKPASNS